MSLVGGNSRISNASGGSNEQSSHILKAKGHTGNSNTGPAPATNLTSPLAAGAKSGFLKSYKSHGSRRQGGAQVSGSRTRVAKKRDDKARVMMNGKDVTPRPLGVSMAVPAAAGFMGSSVASMGTFASLDENAPINLLSNKKGAGASAASNADDAMMAFDSIKGLSDGDRLDKIDENGTGDGDIDKDAAESAGLIPLRQQRDIVQHEWTEEELEEKATVTIEETDTIMLLQITSTQVWSEHDVEHKEVTTRNKEYESLLQDHKTKDRFVARSAQTFNESARDKEIQTCPPPASDACVGVTTWDLYDVFHSQDAEDGRKLALLGQGNGGNANGAGDANGIHPTRAVRNVSDEDNEAKGQSSSAGGAESSAIQTSHHSLTATRRSDYLDGGGSSHDGSRTGDLSTVSVSSDVFAPPSAWDKIKRIPSFLNSLRVMERALAQTAMHREQLLYRSIAPPQSSQDSLNEMKSDEDAHQTAPFASLNPQVSLEAAARAEPHLQHLWSYASDESKNRTVTCMDWNKANKDLLAVGYGKMDFGSTEEGLILFWTPKNPRHPEKMIRTKHGVTAMDFCAELPHLLAVGFYNGSVALYDVRERDDKPFLESQHATGKHSEPVWGLKWVCKGQGQAGEEGQKLTSISTDGSVYQWSMKKGLVPHEIMQLKRVPNLAKFLDTSADSVSRQASGLCIDFPLNDDGQYVVGTEDGLIHKCSVSYNEQTLDNFFGHTGPVYKLRCSPFASDVFLSCSADWTAALWSQKNTKPVLSFQSGRDYVVDVRWSPSQSCVFATVSRDGRIEVWNLEESSLDPIIKHRFSDKSKLLTCVLFAPSAPVLLSGGSDGKIDVYRINGIPFTGSSHTQQVQRLLDVIYEHAAAEPAVNASSSSASGAAAENDVD